MLKAYIIKCLDRLFRPFIGTGIGNHFPFRQFISIYSKISKNEHAFVIKKTSYDFVMELESGKLVDEVILKTGIWEKGVSEIIRKYLKNGDVFVDIGANIGYDSLLASTIIGDTGHVFSFEPSGKNFNRLQRNIALNKFINIHTHNIGVGDKKETLLIHYNDFNPGETSLVPGLGSTSRPDEKVNIDALDDLMQGRKINFIKMDIEGFEPKAFEGMKKILQDNKDIKIIFEFSPLLYGTTEQLQKEVAINLLMGLRNSGFKLYHICDENSDLSTQEISSFDDYCQPFFEGVSKQSDIFCARSL